MLRKILIGVAVVVVLFVGLAASVIIPFTRYAPVEPGTKLPGGAVLVQDGNSNVYILPTGPDKAVLIDCGMDENMEAVSVALTALGMGLADVEAVLITHAHPDHVGGCKALAGAKLYAMQDEVGAIEGTAVTPGLMSTVTFARPSPTGLKVTGLNDGEQTTIAGLSVSAYANPGHTPGSGAYLINGVLYIGDAAGITPDGKTAPAPWIFNTDGALAEASLRALGERLANEGAKVEKVATGHSAPGPFSALRP